MFQLMKEAFLETLWPNRCALCDLPGPLLCAGCTFKLTYINPLTACPICGSPFGNVQCCDCTTTLLEPLGLEAPPFDGCVSATVLDGRSGRIVTLYKDAGDRELARTIASVIAGATPPSWIPGSTVTCIPASPKAIAKRGWDHAERLGRAYAKELVLPFAPLFNRPTAKDQRRLSRAERFKNMSEAITLKEGVSIPPIVILVDDVYTTGSTFFAASALLKANGCQRVYCASFTRTQ